MRQKEVTIGNTTYMLTSYKTTLGLKYMKQLGKLLGPAFLELQKTAETTSASKKSKEKAEEQAFFAAAQTLLDNLDNVDFENLVAGLISNGVTKNGMTVNFDIEFSGQLDDLFLLLKEVASFNFGNVFSLLGSDMGQQSLAK